MTPTLTPEQQAAFEEAWRHKTTARENTGYSKIYTVGRYMFGAGADWGLAHAAASPGELFAESAKNPPPTPGLREADIFAAFELAGIKPGDYYSRTRLLEVAQAILALLAPHAEGWRPISSAPKDGTVFLAWIVHEPDDYSPERFERPSLCHWRHRDGAAPFAQAAGWERQWIGEPTYWQPLLSSPAPGDE